MAGAGEGAEYYWGKQRDSSMEGIERLYDRGEISREEYNTIIKIRNLSDEEWEQVELKYNNGEISQEEYEVMEEIREMPEDWKSTENLFKGLGYAGLTGLWEGSQWYIGGKLLGWSPTNNTVLNSLFRIGIDTAFNAGDPVYRAGLEALLDGEDFGETFEKQGGWDAVLINSIIGLVGSAGGEAFDAHNSKKLTNRINNLDSIKGLDDSTSRRIKEILDQENRKKIIDFNKMTDIQLNQHILELLNNRNSQIDDIAKYLYGDQSGNISDQVKSKIANGVDAINRTGLLDNMDENTATSIRNLIMEDYINNKINLEDIPNLDIGSYLNTLNTQEISNILKNMDKDSTFEYLSKGNGKYGVDQGLFTTLEQRDPVAYQEIKNKLMKEYGFSAYDSERFMQIVDAVGACPYARTANVICDYFKDMPEKFEEIFGFPLYKKNANGVWKLNDAELLADLYYWGNTQGEGAVLIKLDENGNAVINEDAIRMDDGQISMVMQRGSSWEELSDYLASKTDNIQCESNEILNYANFESKENIINELRGRIDNGEILSVGFGPNNPNIPIRFENAETGAIVSNVRGGHWVKIIDVTDDGLIVSSWGIKCFVSFDDLINNSQFSFISDSISIK